MLGDRVLRSAIASKAVYSPSMDRPRCHGRGGRSATCVIPDRSKKDAPRAFIWRSGDRSLFVAFRGTTGMRDLLGLLDMRTANFGYCGSHVNVHSGMLSAFGEIERDMTDTILDARPKSIVFTGHSKGGCHAQFAAAYYKTMLAGNCKVACHTFGALRTGDRTFSDWYNGSVDDSLVFVDRQDPVRLLQPFHDLKGWHEIGAGGGVEWFPVTLKAHDMSSYLDSVAAAQRLPGTLPLGWLPVPVPAGQNGDGPAGCQGKFHAVDATDADGLPAADAVGFGAAGAPPHTYEPPAGHMH